MDTAIQMISAIENLNEAIRHISLLWEGAQLEDIAAEGKYPFHAPLREISEAINTWNKYAGIELTRNFDYKCKQEFLEEEIYDLDIVCVLKRVKDAFFRLVDICLTNDNDIFFNNGTHIKWYPFSRDISEISIDVSDWVNRLIKEIEEGCAVAKPPFLWR